MDDQKEGVRKQQAEVTLRRPIVSQATLQHVITCRPTQLPEVGTGKLRWPTSNILLRSVDTRNYATENCV